MDKRYTWALFQSESVGEPGDGENQTPVDMLMMLSVRCRVLCIWLTHGSVKRDIPSRDTSKEGGGVENK